MPKRSAQVSERPWRGMKSVLSMSVVLSVLMGANHSTNASTAAPTPYARVPDGVQRKLAAHAPRCDGGCTEYTSCSTFTAYAVDTHSYAANKEPHRTAQKGVCMWGAGLLLMMVRALRRGARTPLEVPWNGSNVCRCATKWGSTIQTDCQVACICALLLSKVARASLRNHSPKVHNRWLTVRTVCTVRRPHAGLRMFATKATGDM